VRRRVQHREPAAARRGFHPQAAAGEARGSLRMRRGVAWRGAAWHGVTRGGACRVERDGVCGWGRGFQLAPPTVQSVPHMLPTPLPLFLPAGAARAARLPAPRAHRSRRSLPPPPAVRRRARARARARAAEPQLQAPSQPMTADMLVFRADPGGGGGGGRGQGWLCLTISRALLLRVSARVYPGPRALPRCCVSYASRTPCSPA
jgi:hypothetical protein